MVETMSDIEILIFSNRSRSIAIQIICFSFKTKVKIPELSEGI